MRIPLIAGNWKMHKTIEEAQSFVQTIVKKLPSTTKVEALICASPILIDRLVAETKESQLHIGAQNMFYEKEGAYTGEVSPYALAESGAKYVIIGHSERRELFGETDEIVNKKMHAAYAYGLLPIMCCGETLAEREAKQTEAVVEKQVLQGLANLEIEEIKKATIAYEPIWAIGTGSSSSAEEANDVCRHIRKTIEKEYGKNVAEAVRIQYGGSVNPNNIRSFLQQSDIDGALVGGASLEPQSFLSLMEAAL